MGTSSSDDEISRELSNLSASSAVSGKSAATTKDGHYSDENFDDSDNETISRQDTSMSGTSAVSSRPTSSRPSSSKRSSAAQSRENTINSERGVADKEVLSRQDTSVSDTSAVSSRPPSSRVSSRRTSALHSRENTMKSKQNDDDNKKDLSRESTMISEKNHGLSRESTIKSEQNHGLSRESTIKSDQNDDLSRESTTTSSTTSEQTNGVTTRENTNISVTSNHSNREGSSRESSILSRQKEDTRSHISRETTQVSQNSYYDDFDDSDVSREQSFDSREGGGGGLEKEDSVLIEKDGKFKLVEEKDLTAEQRETLGLPKRRKKKSQTLTLPKVGGGRVRKTSNPEYDNVTSQYGMSEQQKEMKIKRVSVIHMRKQEEKERLKQEEEEKRTASDKSFKKWLADKKDANGENKPEVRKKKKSVKVPRPPPPPPPDENEDEEERREASDKAFKEWLDEKKVQSNDEKKMEKIRLTEEAQNYVVRDRNQCDKAFREWLRQKKVEKQEGTTQRKKSYYKPPIKKKSLAPIYSPAVPSEEKIARRPRSSVHARKEKNEKEKETQRRPKTSKVRMADNFGYRHPASIDDFVGRKW